MRLLTTTAAATNLIYSPVLTFSEASLASGLTSSGALISTALSSCDGLAWAVSFSFVAVF